MRFCCLLGIFAVLVIMVSAGQSGVRAAPVGGTTIGPVQISVLGHPRLCWEAAGNGSAVTLERASAAAHALPATSAPPHPLDDPPTWPQTPIS